MDPNQPPPIPQQPPAQPPYSPVPPAPSQQPVQPGQYQQPVPLAPTPGQPPYPYGQPQPPTPQAPYLQPLQYAPYRPTPPPAVPPSGLQPLGMATSKKQKTLGSTPATLLFNEWMKKYWKVLGLSLVGVFILGVVIFQIVYPNDRLLPGVTVDGVAVGGMRKSEAASKLDAAYGNLKLDIFFGKATAAFLSPKIKDVGIGIVNEDRINSISYPFYLRILPGSFLFASSFSKAGSLQYAYDTQKIQNYTQTTVGGSASSATGSSCTIPARNATLKLVNNKLQVVSSTPGETCDIAQFQQQLGQVKPVAGAENNVHIPSTETPAPVDNDIAAALASKLNDRLNTPMPMSVAGSVQQIPNDTVLGWLDFTANVPQRTVDNSANATATLDFSINKDRFSSFMNGGISAAVTVKPGVTKISTLDFTVTSQTNGPGGRMINIAGATSSVTDYINGKNNQAVAVTQDVGPTMQYTRNYTPTSTGYQALATQFAQDNPGTYGIVIKEINGPRVLRAGSYNADTKIPSAGIESLYIGYDTTVNLQTGYLLPGTIIDSGRDVQTCLKQMFAYSDDSCRLGFFKQFGYNNVASLAPQMSLTNTIFSDYDGVTSANDVANTLYALRMSKIGQAANASQILGYMQNIRQKSGIPTGLSSSDQVAHVIGSSSTVYNDAAIVSSPKGQYILVVLSQNSGWDKVAALAQKIEAFQQVQEPNSMR